MTIHKHIHTGHGAPGGLIPKQSDNLAPFYLQCLLFSEAFRPNSSTKQRLNVLPLHFCSSVTNIYGSVLLRACQWHQGSFSRLHGLLQSRTRAGRGHLLFSRHTQCIWCNNKLTATLSYAHRVWISFQRIPLPWNVLAFMMGPDFRQCQHCSGFSKENRKFSAFHSSLWQTAD